MALYNLFKLYCGGTFGFDFLESANRDKASADYRAGLIITMQLEKPVIM